MDRIQDDIQDRSSFDSTLYNTPLFLGEANPDIDFDLTIYVKVHLHKLDPPRGRDEHFVRDFDNNRVRCLRWSDADWTAFTSRYAEQVNNFWDRSFKLIPPASYNGFVAPRNSAAGTRRNVACGFRVLLQDRRNGAHASIGVVNVAPDVTFFRSHSLLYSNLDLRADDYTSDTGRVSWEFFTAPHEVGHLLGLGHSNENSRECRAAPDSAVCYGGGPHPILTLQMDAMGQGPMLSLEHARPWLRRIARHTRTRDDEWTATWLSADAAFRGADQVHLH